ncbi:hypothetical protein Tco_0466105 [Tanacetum coccineum]
MCYSILFIPNAPYSPGLKAIGTFDEARPYGLESMINLIPLTQKNQFLHYSMLLKALIQLVAPSYLP